MFITDAVIAPSYYQQNNIAMERLSILIGHMIAMFGPLIGSVVLWRKQASYPKWKWSLPKYYLWIAIATIAFWVIPGIVGLFLGDKIVNPIDQYIWIYIVIIILFGWISGTSEEVGWCAYLLPELSKNIGKSRALLISNIIRGLWHWPVLILPVVLQVISGEHTIPELIGAGIVIAIQLIISNIFFGSIFGWIWYQTESIPLVGWLHYFYDMARDVTSILLVGYSSSLWVVTLNPFFLYPIGIMLFFDILANEGLNIKTLFRSEKPKENKESS
jgi:membrane protease YdiL (CAAX protease family)